MIDTIKMITEFKSKLAGGAVLGPFCKSGDPAFIEAAGYAGFDFVILDLEHGPNTYQTLQNLIRGALCGGALPVVRVPGIHEECIGKALDVGAAAVQIPQVATAAQAELAVRLAKFYPRGERGVCKYVRAAGYSSVPPAEYFKKANETLVILQLEGREAIENLDEITEVQGVDILFVGPYDLSQSLGVPGDVLNPKVTDKMKYIVDKAAAKGITTGTFVDNIENARVWRDAGVRYMSYLVDVGIFMEACKTAVAGFGR